MGLTAIYKLQLTFLSFLMMLCYFQFERGTKEYKIHRKLIIEAISALLWYVIFLCVKGATLKSFALGMRYAMDIWISIAVFDLCNSMAEIDKKKIPFRKAMTVLAFINTFSVLVTPFTGHAYTLIQARTSYGLGYWAVSFKPALYFHLALCYIYCLLGVPGVVKKSIASPRIYKFKYISFLAPLLLVLIMSVFCYTLNKPFDYSITLYALLTFCYCFISVSWLPRKLTVDVNKYTVGEYEMGLVYIDRDGMSVYANQIAQKWFSVSGRPPYSGIDEYFQKASEKYQLSENNVARWKEERIEQGKTLHYKLTFQQITDELGRVVSGLLSIDDVTEETETLEKERFKATHDMLTRLYNRPGFFEAVRERLKNDPEESYYMIASDLQDFKLINDLFGYYEGDRLLLQQAELIREHATEGNISAKMEGGHFGMLLKKSKFDEQVFLESVEKLSVTLQNYRFIVHYKIGVYEITDKAAPVQSMYDHAMMAIDLNKNDYARSIVFYSDPTINNLLQEKEIVNSFRAALDDNEFVMYLQPQMDAGGKRLGAEALVRWQHPERGLIFPGSFIGVLEKAHFITDLDRNMWEQAARQLSEWKKQGLDAYYIAVNVSAEDFRSCDVLQAFSELAEKYDIDQRSLKIEITESTFVDDLSSCQATVAELRNAGFSVEIDDFGSGFSSLALLKNITTDALKVDMEFVRQLEKSEKGQILLHSIIKLAKELEITVIVEGVETKELCDMLLEMGCEIFQGYYFSKPISVQDFTDKYLSAEQ